MHVDYNFVIGKIDELIKLLEEIEAIPEPGSNNYLEDVYLSAKEFVDSYKPATPMPNDVSERVNLVALMDLANWIFKARESDSFDAVIEHIRLLKEASPLMNTRTKRIIPGTNKTDSASDKMVELMLGCVACGIGSELDLDDPNYSSGGTNPDVMFTYDGVRVSLACKKLHSKSIDSIRDNIIKAAEQIVASNCNRGYIVLNVQNVANHLQSSIETLQQENLIACCTEDLIRLLSNVFSEISQCVGDSLILNQTILTPKFIDPKIAPAIILLGQTFVLSNSIAGLMPTSLKFTELKEFTQAGALTDFDKRLHQEMNHFIQTYQWDPNAPTLDEILTSQEGAN